MNNVPEILYYFSNRDANKILQTFNASIHLLYDMPFSKLNIAIENLQA
jgi:hypothetical protein